MYDEPISSFFRNVDARYMCIFASLIFAIIKMWSAAGLYLNKKQLLSGVIVTKDLLLLATAKSEIPKVCHYCN